jgi:hypothetical protein
MKKIENILFWASIPVITFWFLQLTIDYTLDKFEISEKSYHDFMIVYGLLMLVSICNIKIMKYIRGVS